MQLSCGRKFSAEKSVVQTDPKRVVRFTHIAGQFEQLISFPRENLSAKEARIKMSEDYEKLSLEAQARTCNP
jgi:hypothetical protein